MVASRLKKALFSIHRRRRTIESYEWWNYLNYAQKFAVSSLYKFGYEINFVRQVSNSSLVVMSLDGNQVTVDQGGLINTHPDIKTRR